MFELREPEQSPPAPQMFGNAGREHMEKYGSKPEHFAWIGWKNHKHSVNNPYAQFQDEYSLEEIKAREDDPRAADEAAVLADLRRLGLRDRRVRAVRRRARPLGPGGRDRRPVDGHRHARAPSTSSSCIKIVGSDMSKEAADQAYEEAGRRRRRTSTSSSCTTASRANELITYEALGFAAEGEGHKLVEAEATTYGGTLGRQPVRRADLQGPPARRDRARAVLRADLAAARRRPTSARSTARRSPCSTTSASAAPPSSPSTSRQSPDSNNEQRATSDEEQMTTTTNTSASAVHRRAARLPGGDRRLLRARARDQGAARAHHRGLHRAAQPGDLREARRARLARGLDRRGVRRLRRRVGRRVHLPRGDHARPRPDRRLRRQPDRRRRLRALRHRGAEGGDPRRDHPRAGRGDRDVGARGGLGRRQPLLPRRASERRLRPQRPEDLDLGRAHRRPHPRRSRAPTAPAPSTRA